MRRKIEIEPEGSRWIHVHDQYGSKRFDREGDAEAWAAARARSLGGAELIIKNDRGETSSRIIES